MPSINHIKNFDALWNRARAETSEQGAKVSYGEIKQAIASLSTDGAPSRADAAHVADTMASEPTLTRPAAKEALAFLKTIGAGHELDEASMAAIRAEFSLRASAPFKSLSVPGREVRNTFDLPDSVLQAMKETQQGDQEGTWETAVAKKATLAGQSVFIVHYSGLDDGNDDAEKVRLFSSAGKEIAHGSVFDPMAGFSWDS